MSDTLVAYAAPLLETLPADAPVAAREASLLFASLVWNDANQAVADGSTTWWATWRRRARLAKRLATESGVARASARALVRMLDGRKHALFPHDRRLVLDVRARPLWDGEVRVEAVSALPA